MNIINDRIYGPIKIDDVIYELINTPSLKRLSKIHQSGAAFLVFPHANTTRLEHSIGVSHIIQLLEGSIEEQVAGLLHDISHSCFSHVIDYLYTNESESTHEDAKQEYFFQNDIINILNKYSLNAEKIFHEDNWPRLESPLPNLCADRIDYTLRDYVIWAKRPVSDISKFLNDMIFIDGIVALKNKESAIWFSDFFRELNELYFRHPKNISASKYLVDILKEALDLNIISKNDLGKDDSHVLNLIKNSPLSKMLEEDSILKAAASSSNSTLLNIKTREVNPFIYSKNQLTRLSTYNSLAK
jgi:HD superfamily phosphohydrolase